MNEKTIFKKIIDGELPAYKVYEDQDFLAFLDIFPEAPGHVVIIPKVETKWVWDVENYEQYFSLVKKLVQVLRIAFNTDWILSKVLGEEVPHAHIHLIPGIEKDGSETDFEAIQQKIIEALKKSD